MVNCSNAEKDLLWLQKQAANYQPIKIRDLTNSISLLALQGPLSVSVLEVALNSQFDYIKRFYFDDYSWNGTRITISRTGYTGEDGFELFVDAGHVANLWNLLLDKSKPDGLRPVGLGARDTLRLEAGLLLYGNEMNETITPLETTIGWTVKFDKDNFIGKDSLLRQKTKGIDRKLAGFEMIDRGIPRQGYPVLKENEIMGKVTSGSFSPTTNKNIGLCLIKSQYAHVGEGLQIQIRDNTYKARVVNTPFYKGRSVNEHTRRTNLHKDARMGEKNKSDRGYYGYYGPCATATEGRCLCRITDNREGTEGRRCLCSCRIGKSRLRYFFPLIG